MARSDGGRANRGIHALPGGRPVAIQDDPGKRGFQMMRPTAGDVSEFVVISYWESRDAIHAFAGGDIEKPHHLPRDSELLLELPQAVQHFDMLVD
jgi:heme-degrading monooxygenase HmoA